MTIRYIAELVVVSLVRTKFDQRNDEVDQGAYSEKPASQDVKDAEADLAAHKPVNADSAEEEGQQDVCDFADASGRLRRVGRRDIDGDIGRCGLGSFGH